MSSYTVGRAEMQLLPTRLAYVPNMDGSQTTRGDISKIPTRTRQPETHENEGKNSTLLIFGHMGPTQ